MNIVWTFEALEDLKNFDSYYSRIDEALAIRLCHTIGEEIDLLSDFPYIAQIEPHLSSQPKTFRSLIALSGLIKIIYFIEGDNIYITHLWDCRRNPADMKPR